MLDWINSDRRPSAVSRFYRPFSTEVPGPVGVTLAPVTIPWRSSPLDWFSCGLCLGLVIVSKVGLLDAFSPFSQLRVFGPLFAGSLGQGDEVAVFTAVVRVPRGNMSDYACLMSARKHTAE